MTGLPPTALSYDFFVRFVNFVNHSILWPSKHGTESTVKGM